MPELPEVEITKKTLKKYVEHQYIADIKINNYNLRYKINKNFKKNLLGKKINKITRRSKYLIFHLSDKNFFILHLGMTGRVLVKQNKIRGLIDTSFYASTLPIDKHNHIYLIFKKNTVVYNDTRRFGFIKYYTATEFKNCSHLSKLGVEPLSDELNFSFFKRNIIRFNKSIKNTLMDQSFICGLGNIYVNEALFLSKINPNKSSLALHEKEIKVLINYIKKILKKSIAMGGSSIKDFHNSEGKYGKFQNTFKVYGQENKKCVRQNCTGLIKKSITGGRATFFCTNCQSE